MSLRCLPFSGRVAPSRPPGCAIMLSQTAINMGTGASINGRLMAQTAVTIASTTITAPAP